MVDHKVTITNSGSWKADIEFKNGEVKFSESYSHNIELTVEAKCSCGMEFETPEQAHQHIKERQGIL